MLFKRLFEPKDNQTLFHYCSTDSFKAIVESNRLRFTDINMLNDQMEYKWGYEIFEKAATKIINRSGIASNSPIIPREFFDAVDNILSKGQLIAHPFIASLTREFNSLDQWRKYAEDGKGYAIGFNASNMKSLGFQLLDVLYDEDEQINEMIYALLAVYESNPDLDFSSNQESFNDIVLITVFMTAMKHPSFKSENEIRCLRTISINSKTNSLKFIDNGAIFNDGKTIDGESVNFINKNGMLTAYVDIPLSFEENKSSIKEVILGPKNGNSLGNVKLFLSSKDLNDVKITHSNLPYR